MRFIFGTVDRLHFRSRFARQGGALRTTCSERFVLHTSFHVRGSGPLICTGRRLGAPPCLSSQGLTCGAGGWIMHGPRGSLWVWSAGRRLTGAWRVNAREHQFLRITWTGAKGHLVDALASDADEGRGTLRKSLVRRVQPQKPGVSEWGNPAPVAGRHRAVRGTGGTGRSETSE